VSTPRAAATDNRFVTAACTGTSSERKATISSRKLSASTVRTTSGSRAAITSARSTLLAVLPPTWASMPEPAVAGGSTSSRIVVTSFAVAGEDGARSGIALMISASPALLSWGGNMPTTPLVPEIASCIATMRGSVPRASPPAFVTMAVS
jgi:hypothetical protein